MKLKDAYSLGRKVMTNLDSIFKIRDIPLPTKVRLVKAMVFTVVMYGCENWTVKKAECRKIDALELWCWRRLLRVPWTARRSNQSILKGICPGCSLEALMLKSWNSKLWPPHVKSWLIGRNWRQEEKGTTEDEMAGWLHQLDGQGSLACCNSWSCKELDRTEWLNWTDLIYSSWSHGINIKIITHPLYIYFFSHYFNLIVLHKYILYYILKWERHIHSLSYI